MMIKERQSYDRDFKQKAVELSFARGNAKEIAEDLGIRPELLYRWRREYQTIEEFEKNNHIFNNAA
jgi:transposase